MKCKIEKVAVYCGSAVPAYESYSKAAAEVGRILAENGKTLVFGGSASGTMKTIADNVFKNNGKVIGVFPAELSEELMYEHLTEVHKSPDLQARKNKMLELADALIVLPGSIGTWDELFDALARSKIAGKQSFFTVAVMNINGFYEPLKELLHNSFKAGFSSKKDIDMIKFYDNPDNLTEFLK